MPAPEPLTEPSRLLSAIHAGDRPVADACVEAYGPNTGLHEERLAHVVAGLQRFVDAYGDTPCAVYRVPCRISLNPHSDHQGAWVPYGTHARELIMVAAPGRAGTIRIANTDPRAAEMMQLQIGEERDRCGVDWQADWVSAVQSPDVRAAVLARADGRESTGPREGAANYVVGAVLRLLFAGYTGDNGLRLALAGDIPQAGGLSSSSSLVVGSALAWMDFGGYELDRCLLAELCGEGEWYVGTRGGSGDHAAMLLGARDALAHLCFEAPCGVRGVRLSAFPSGWTLLLANSGVQARKSAEEQRHFNRGIFAYRFAYLALRRELERAGVDAALLERTRSLGDIHSGRFDPSLLFRLITSLPDVVAPESLADEFPAVYRTAAMNCFGTDDPAELPPRVPLRGAAVYGLGRVDRGRMMPQLLDVGDDASMLEFGRLMAVTHDGDRLFRCGEPWRGNRESLACERWEALSRRQAEGVRLHLRDEPGFYGASIAALDAMVDVATAVPGVAGAGLMGAGGGGYVLILCRSAATPDVVDALTEQYYVPNGVTPDVEPWQSVAAAGRLL